jgi:hypothetical protein
MRVSRAGVNAVMLVAVVLGIVAGTRLFALATGG